MAEILEGLQLLHLWRTKVIDIFLYLHFLNLLFTKNKSKFSCYCTPLFQKNLWGLDEAQTVGLPRSFLTWLILGKKVPDFIYPKIPKLFQGTEEKLF